jgi:hypothetical protein
MAPMALHGILPSTTSWKSSTSIKSFMTT